jgi:LysM repeat protein
VARRMAAPTAPAGTSTSGYHRVRRGETLSGIADEYGVSQRDLRRWNSLDTEGHIQAGQRLRVAPPARTGASAASAGRTHTVRSGDTLDALAKRYGITVDALREVNGMSSQDVLRKGVAIKIPG